MRKADLELDRERRNQILDAALHCFLQLGYAKTSMDYVAMNANLSRPLNDLDEKFHNMVDLIIEDPSIADVIDAHEYTNKRDVGFSIYILWICAHAYAMRQRKVLDTNEWTGWLYWMRNCFRKGTIGEKWKQVEPDRWFNPAFQDFVNKEIVGAKLQT
ncbi:MAG: TetR/AcrR family transcriptional regulator [Nitrososphaeraceae archaeon]